MSLQELKQLTEMAYYRETKRRRFRMKDAAKSRPMTEVRIAKALPDAANADVSAALKSLVENGRVEVQEGRSKHYQLTNSAHRLVKEPWMARIDALAHLMRAVGQVTEARFKRGDDRAFARTLGFRMRPDDAARLQAA